MMARYGSPMIQGRSWIPSVILSKQKSGITLLVLLDTKSPRRQIYVNGELVAEDEAAFDMVTTTYPLQMGYKETDPTFQFRGLIDEVRVWDVVRTEEEIQQDMEEIPKAVLPIDKLAATWGQLKTWY